MQRYHLNYFLAALMLFLTTLGTAAYAQSGNTWLPEFEAGQHVYVDSKLKTGSYPVSFDGLEAELIKAGKEQGLEIYFIAAEQGANLPYGGSTSMSAIYLNEVQSRWASNPALNKDNYLIIAWVRKADRPDKGSVGAVGGTFLKGMGMKEAYFSGNSGPIGRDIRRFMPADPKGLAAQVARNVNDDIAAAKFKQNLPMYIGGGIGAVIFLGLFVFLIIRFRRRKAEASKTLAEFSAKVNSANELHVKLHGSYMGFLSAQADWKTRFVGETKTQYEAALTKFAMFSARLKAAITRQQEAEKLLKGSIFPGVSKFLACVKALTEDTVTVTGDDIPLEEATLFGGLVEATDYTPQQLLAAMDELFTETNRALAGIVEAFKGAEQNRKDIERLLGSIDEITPRLTAAELVFDPYESRLASIKERQGQFLTILASNPLKAFRNSEEVEADTEALKADLNRAIEIKGSLPAVLERIEAVTTRTATLRGKSAGYAYQLSGKEAAPATANENFKLDAEGGNPDPILAKARRFHAEAGELVYAGKLDEAETARQNARDAGEGADKLISDTLKAKEFVEQKVAPAHETVAALAGEIPAGNAAVSELKSDFLPKNIKGYPEKLTTAEAVRDKHASVMATVKSLYDSQNFLRARAVLTGQQSEIDSSRQEIRDTHEWLATLRKQRVDSRATVERCNTLIAALTPKIKQNSFTTAGATDDRHDKVDAELKRLRKATAERVADWPALDSEALKAEQELKAIDKQIDVEKTAYQAAASAVDSAETAVSQAAPYVAKDYVRNPAEEAHASAREKLASANTLLGTAKADWSRVKSLADAAKKLAEDAEAKAKDDVKKAKAAKDAISTAESDIRSYGSHHYGEGVSANLSSARSKLRDAESYMSSGNYESAKSSAESASSQADDADSAAKRKVRKIKQDRADAVAAAAAAAAAASRRSSSNDSGFGGGGLGGGGNYGGGGGGGNYSGGAGGQDY